LVARFENRQQQMFDRNELVVHFLRNDFGFIERFDRVTRKLQIAARNFWETLDRGVDHLCEKRQVHIEFFEQKRRDILIDFEYRLHEVRVLYLLLPKTLRKLLRVLQGFLGFDGKIIDVHILIKLLQISDLV